MFVDLAAADRDWRDLYKLLIGFITPRPIALVSTISAGGAANLAPFSWYNMVSANPPVCMFSPSVTRTGGAKDTLVNIRATGEFCIATVTDDIIDGMVRCATPLPYEQSEFDWSGLTPAPATRVTPALVKEAHVNIECRLREIMTFGDTPGAGNAIFGDIVAIHVDDAVVADDGLIDAARLRTVGRLGRQLYSTVTAPFERIIPAPPPPH